MPQSLKFIVMFLQALLTYFYEVRQSRPYKSNFQINKELLITAPSSPADSTPSVIFWISRGRNWNVYRYNNARGSIPREVGCRFICFIREFPRKAPHYARWFFARGLICVSVLPLRKFSVLYRPKRRLSFGTCNRSKVGFLWSIFLLFLL